MPKFFLLCLILTLFLYPKDVRLLGGCVDVNGTTANAQDGVNAFYEDMTLMAPTISYDTNKTIINATGNVYMNRKSKYYILTKDAKIDIKNESKLFKPLFLHDKQSNLWFLGDKVTSKKNLYTFHDAIVSSCNYLNPDWKISYSSGIYNAKKKEVSLYNMLFFAGKIPLFYLPYLSFSTDNKRRSGFLSPTIAISSNEGIFYEQPYYFALADNYDLELRAQIRTKRSKGIIGDFRFINSIKSKGKITLGYFKEFNDDNETFKYKNKEHFGIDFDYEQTDIFNSSSNKQITDKFFTNIKLYNDIDYISLKTKEYTKLDTQTVLTSKVNYMITSPSNYLGIYGKYLYDTTATTTTTTLQELPKIQYHKFNSSLWSDNFIYSINYLTTFKTRARLANARESIIEVPLIYTIPLFNDYINLSLLEDITASNISFTQTNGDKRFKSGNYLNISQIITVDTDLVKEYDQNIHFIKLSTKYQFPIIRSVSGFYENKERQFNNENCIVGNLCEFARSGIEKVKEKIDFGITQYLFDNANNQWIYHKMVQPITIENGTLGVLENELRFKLSKKISVYNNLFFSVKDKNFDKISSGLEYKQKGFNIDISHLYQNQLQTSRKSDFYTTKLAFDTSKNYNFIFQYNYNNLKRELGNYLAKIEMKKDCWSYSIELSRRIIPTSFSSLSEQYLGFKITLIPIWEFSYKHQLNSE